MSERNDWAKNIETFGPDFGLFPSSCWGRRDWKMARARYQPLNKMLPPAAPTRTLQGFSLFPNRQRAPGRCPLRASRTAV